MKTFIATVLVFTLAMVSPAFAKKKATPTPSDEARIMEVNAVAITITLGKSGDQSKEYTITKDTKITLNGQPATTDNLLANMVAEVKPSAGDPTVAASIDAKDAPKR